MIQIVHYGDDGSVRSDLGPADLAGLRKKGGGLLWVDFQGESPAVCEPILRDVFGFHPLAIDDALQESHVPKVDDWERYLYIVLHAVAVDIQPELRVASNELDLFLGTDYLISHHDAALPPLERVRNRCLRDRRRLSAGPDHIVYLLADEVVSDCMKVYDDLDNAYEMIEAEIFERPRSETLERILNLKRALLKLRRTIAPQREVLNKLARDEYDVIDAPDRVFFRDVYDHLVRLFDINESMRDQVGGALETYLSVINNRMNDVMKTLTVITTLFMPISFLTGFFGMNFFGPVAQLQPWTDRPVFFLALAVTLLTPALMLSWIRRKGWL